MIWPQTGDGELLRAYVERGDEESFGALVRRHTGLVFSAARRQTANAYAAADVTQTVFIILARKAATLRREKALTGWLLKTTYYTAANARRQAQRRQFIERKAMQELDRGSEDPNWAKISLLLDEELLALGDRDRLAVALRHLEQRSYKEIGLTLGISEDGARKRVERALGRLRARLVKRGATGTVGAFGVALAEHGVTAAPRELAGMAAAAALTGAKMGLPTLASATLRTLEWIWWRSVAVGAAGAVAAVMLILGSARWAMAEVSPKDKTARESVVGSNRIIAGEAAAAAGTNASEGNFRLRVVDAGSGRAVSGAKLTLRESADLSSATKVFATDASGEAAFDLEREFRPFWGERIEMFKDGYVLKHVSWSAAQFDPINEIPNAYTTKLDPAVEIGGVVRDEKGKPVAGARVVFSVGGINHSEETDGAGVWRCHHVPGDFGAITFQVYHPDFAGGVFGVTTGAESAGTPSDASGFRYLTEAAYRAGTAVMTLTRGGVAKGRVVDESGSAIAGAKVTENQAWNSVFATVKTGMDGRFAFCNVAGENLELTVMAGGFAPLTVTNHAGREGEQELILSRGAALLGRVVNEDGKPVAGAIVDMAGDDFGRTAFDWETHTGVDGRFEWDFAPTERECYSISAGAFALSELWLTADGTEHLVKLNRRGELPGPMISGTVVDAETGKGIEAFEIGANSVGEMNFPAIAKGKNGKFSVTLGLGQPWDLVCARAEGYWPQVITNRDESHRRLHFALHRASDITGVVTLPNGQAAVGAEALLCTLSAQGYMTMPGQFDLTRSRATHARVDDEGRFRFAPEIGIGAIRIAHPEGYGEVTVEQLQESKTVVLQPWGRVEGTFRVDGVARGDALVALGEWRDGPFSQSLHVSLAARTDAQGHFVFEGVPSGKFVVFPREAISLGRFVQFHHTDDASMTIETSQLLQKNGTPQMVDLGRTTEIEVDAQTKSVAAN